MKKILLATTLLAGTAGFAAAEVSFSGSAAMGIARDAGGSNEFETYSTAGLDVAMSGETDNGLSFGASFDTSVGLAYDFGDGDGFASKSGTFGTPEVFISGAFGKISMKKNGYAEFVEDDAEAGDVKYEFSSGGVSVGLIADDITSEYSASFGYSAEGLSVGAAYDSDDGKTKGTASYTMGAITGTLTVQNATAGANSVKVAYSADGISASVKVDDADGWEVEGGYTVDAISVSVSTNKASEWEATASYDLGGGATVEAGVNFTKDAYAGVSFSF